MLQNMVLTVKLDANLEHRSYFSQNTLPAPWILVNIEGLQLSVSGVGIAGGSVLRRVALAAPACGMVALVGDDLVLVAAVAEITVTDIMAALLFIGAQRLLRGEVPEPSRGLRFIAGRRSAKCSQYDAGLRRQWRQQRRQQ